MAHFYGVVSGRGRATASRVGRKTNGLHRALLRSTSTKREGIDRAIVELTPWRGAESRAV